jgi:hypothetical protein
MHAAINQSPADGRGWARTGFFLGIAVSVAGNIAHTWHPTAAALAITGDTADQWRPEPGAQAAAAFFPIALLVTVEILSRVKWAHNWRSWAARYGGAGLVAGVAGIVSYLHLRGLLQAYGEDRITATLGPLSIDGLMIVAGFALIAIGSPVPARRDIPGADDLPPAPALPEYEVSLLRDQPPLQLGQAHAEPGRQDYRSQRRRRPAMAVATGTTVRRRRPQTTAAAPAPEPVVPKPAAAAAPAPLDPDLLPFLVTARDRFAETLATGTAPSVNKIRAKMRVGHPRARAIHDALTPA